MIPLPPSVRTGLDIAFAVLSATVACLFAAMVILVFVQVLDRFVGFGWFWTEEVVRLLLVWSVMAGLPVVLYSHDEILVEVLSLSRRTTIWRLRLAALLGLAFLCILAWQGWSFAARSFSFTSPTLGISRAWVYAAIPVGAVLGCLAIVLRAPDRATAWPGRYDAPGPGTPEPEAAAREVPQ